MPLGQRESREADRRVASAGGGMKARRKASFTVWLLALAAAPFATAWAGGNAYVELSGGFKSGDFGTAVRSDLSYVAPSAGYVAPDYDFSATVPYLRLTQDGSGAGPTESGVGDVVVRGGRVLSPGALGEGILYGSVALKLPTADEGRALGTGATDLGAFLSARWPLDELRLNLQGGYIKSGLGRADNLRDVILYGAGVSAGADRIHWYGSLDGRTALVHGARSPLELAAGCLYAVGGRYFLKGSAFVGLNEGGPGFGIAGGIVRVF